MLLHLLVLLLLGFSELVLPVLSDDYKLEYVSAVFRHGDRSPVITFPGSHYPESFWPQGFGQLTIIGMREEYHLGEIYKNLYIETGFLPRNYTRVKMYIRSTDYDRTLMSGESMLAALYPPEADQQFNPDIPWQPIPIHTVPQSSDILLKGRSVTCPKYKELLELDKTTEEYKRKEEENKDLFNRLFQWTGATYDLSNVWMISDELFIERAHNLTMPDWYSDDLLFHELMPLQDYGMSLYFNTDPKRKITGGVWANEVINNMKKKAEDSEDMKDLKMTFYSAHDTTVAAMLSVFYMYNDIQPLYSSSFIVELYSKQKDYFVKFRYRNNTFSDEVIDLTHPGCSSNPCSLDELARIMQPLMVTADDWNSLCMEDNETGDNSSIIIGLGVVAALFGIILVIILIVMSAALVKACRQRERILRYKGLATNEEL